MFAINQNENSLSNFNPTENNENSTITLRRKNLLENYKLLEDIYFDQGKTEKFITGSGLFKNEENSFQKNCVIVTEGNKNEAEKISDYTLYKSSASENVNKKLENLKHLVIKKFEKECDNLFLGNLIQKQQIKSIEPIKYPDTKEIIKESPINTPSVEEIPIQSEKSRSHFNPLKEEDSSDYINTLIECRSQLREENETKIKQKLENELKPKITKKIYSEKYYKIEEKFKKEVEDQIKDEILSIKLQEVNKLKDKYKKLQNCDLQDIKDKFKSEYKSEYEDKMNKELFKREKEIKTNFLRKLDIFKSKVEQSLKEEFENKKKELIFEISQVKAEKFSDEIAERLKRNKSKKKEKYNSDIEKTQNGNNSITFELTGKQINLSVIDNILPDEIPLNDNNKKLKSINQNIKKLCQMNNNNLMTVNLKELNQKLKSFTNLDNFKYVPSEEIINDKKREVSLIFKENSGNTLKEDLEYLIIKSINSDKRTLLNSKENIKEKGKRDNVSEKEILMYKNRIKNEKQNNENLKLNSISQKNINIPNNNVSNNPINRYECISLKIEETTPISMKEFGKFIVDYIEKEENFKLFLENNQKKIMKGIRNKFTKENKNDHCLSDLLMELWDNLEVSYQQRYKMLIDFLNSDNLFYIYTILDKETEILSEYYEKSKEIYHLIKNREKKKSILQAKINRDELLDSDKEKFVKLTKEISSKIKWFKEKYRLNIIWRGLVYEWIINYESWISIR